MRVLTPEEERRAQNPLQYLDRRVEEGAKAAGEERCRTKRQIGLRESLPEGQHERQLPPLEHGSPFLHEGLDAFAKIRRFAALGDVARLVFHLGLQRFVEAA
jgi:hypothetical protein